LTATEGKGLGSGSRRRRNRNTETTLRRCLARSTNSDNPSVAPMLKRFLPQRFFLGEKTPGPLPVVLRALAATVRTSKTAVIANASHQMIRQEPVGTCAAVLEFLAGD
jgi:pimeloyl-ACP methyl ester carboxylesterase